VLVNAVCHRDYSMANQKTRILLFKNRIEVCTPGRIANTLTLEMIRYGNSAPRNIFLVKLMDNLRYIDGLGRGIPLIIRLMGVGSGSGKWETVFVWTCSINRRKVKTHEIN
jgi:ATP-dependent DNA helicase RecG